MLNKFKNILYAVIALDPPAYNPIPPGLQVPPSAPALTLGGAELVLRIIGNYLMTFAIIFAVIMITWGGISYMFAQDNQTKITAAQARTKNAIIGAAIFLAVGLILKTIASIITGQFFCRISIGPICF